MMTGEVEAKKKEEREEALKSKAFSSMSVDRNNRVRHHHFKYPQHSRPSISNLE